MRRRAGVLMGALLLGLAGGAFAQTAGGPRAVPILVVSRADVLAETQAARALEQAEAEQTARLQADIDAVKAALAKEEEELARLRPTLEREAFEERVTAFDQRVRAERRRAQSQAAVLQQAFRDARRRLVEALDPILEAVRREHGAALIVDRASVLAVAPSVDVTAEAIARFDRLVRVPTVSVPDPGTPLPEGEAAPD